MSRIDPKSLELAMARVKMGLAGQNSRVIGRKIRPEPAMLTMDPTFLLAASDAELKKRVVAFAAAALHGREIARVINAAERRQVDAIIGPGARKFAISNIKYARPQISDAPFEERYNASKLRVLNAFDDMLNGKKTSELSGCLKAALAACRPDEERKA